MMNPIRSRKAWIAAALLLAAPIACSFSKSSESSSDSSTSPSKSSGSSSGEEESARFQNDVEQYTAAYVAGGGEGEAEFFSGLGDLARRRGISDWEADPGTWESIGRGLGRAEVSAEQRTARAQAWVAGDAEKRNALDRGYEASR